MKAMATKSLGLALLAIALLLTWPALALGADESAQYNFASAQGATALQAIPGGEEAVGAIYFYNVDGNKITHVTLKVMEAPEGWVVEIDPPTQNAPYTVGSDIITVRENLYVEPMAVSALEITDAPTGMRVLALPNKLRKLLADTIAGSFQAGEQVSGAISGATGKVKYVSSDYITLDVISGIFQAGETVTGAVSGATIVPTSVEPVPGYCLAKPAYIIVRVPASVPKGTVGGIKILGTGEWLGQSGTAAIAQTRDFNFSVTAVHEITEERPVIPGQGFDVMRWLPVIIAVVVVALGAVMLPRYVTFKKKQ